MCSKHAVCSDVPVLSVYSQKPVLSYGCVIVASDVGGDGLWRKQKLVRQAEGNKVCSANAYCSRIQVIRACVL